METLNVNDLIEELEGHKDLIQSVTLEDTTEI